MLRNPHPAWCILTLLTACGWEVAPPDVSTADPGQLVRSPTTAIVDVDVPAAVVVGMPVTFEVTTTSAPSGGHIEVTIDGVAGNRLERTFVRPGTYEIVVQATTIDSRGGRTVEEEIHQVEVTESVFGLSCGLEPGAAYVFRCTATDDGEPAEARAFTWTMGDERTVTDDALAATTTFDVADAIDHGRASTRFPVTVQDDQGRTASTVVSLGSHVYIGRQHGLIAPLVASTIRDSCPIVAEFDVENPVADATVTFTRFVRRTHSCDRDVAPWDADVPLNALFGRGYPAPPVNSDGNPAGPGTLELRPGESASGTLVLPCDAVEHDACATEYVLAGRADTGEHVQTALWIPHDDPTRTTEPSRVTVATLEALLAAGLLTDPNRVDESELMALEAAGHVRRTSAGWEMN